ncbi:unnamed protein product [Clonostachys rosea]|uniref:Uncharacterized protein n=1 Tax=Bionectria ochroleuca TaxID=29856 RepID=A0ABY6UQS1_BIOOC|nr:unnamed protein product [Clonostachys rosea]
MGLLIPDLIAIYEDVESAWRAADDFAFSQGYALTKPRDDVRQQLRCTNGNDSTPLYWYQEDPCPYRLTLYRFYGSEEWQFDCNRTYHNHGPRDLLLLCQIRNPDFKEEHLDVIQQAYAAGGTDERILSAVEGHFSQRMQPVTIRDIRCITKKLKFESGGLFTFVEELDEHLTENNALHFTRQDLTDCKLQLCISLLSKDVLKAVKQLWKGAKGKGAFMKQADLAKEEGIVPRQENQGRGPNDFLMAWKRTVFAPSVAELEEAWGHLQTDFAAQTDILDYLKKTYFPFREQWARAFTKKYRNFGVDNPTPKGGFQSKARSNFLSAAPNILALAREASEQCDHITSESSDRGEMDGNRHTVKIWDIDFLRDIHGIMSQKAIDMAYAEYLLAHDSLIDPTGKPLKPCTESLTPQYGIPCAHAMKPMLQVGGTSGAPVVTAPKRLPLELFDSFWRGRRANVRIA